MWTILNFIECIKRVDKRCCHQTDEVPFFARFILFKIAEYKSLLIITNLYLFWYAKCMLRPTVYSCYVVNIFTRKLCSVNVLFSWLLVATIKIPHDVISFLPYLILSTSNVIWNNSVMLELSYRYQTLYDNSRNI